MIKAYVVIADKPNGEKTHHYYLNLSTAITATRYMVKSQVYANVILFMAFYQSERKLKTYIPDRTERLWHSDKNDIEELNEISDKG